MKTSKCKGLFFRGSSSTYFNGIDIGKRERLRFLKKKSCPGCDKCTWVLDDLEEMLNNEAVILPNIKQGALYTLKITNVSTDWETGQVDDYDFILKETTESI